MLNRKIDALQKFCVCTMHASVNKSSLYVVCMLQLIRIDYCENYTVLYKCVFYMQYIAININAYSIMHVVSIAYSIYSHGNLPKIQSTLQ